MQTKITLYCSGQHQQGDFFVPYTILIPYLYKYSIEILKYNIKYLQFIDISTLLINMFNITKRKKKKDSKENIIYCIFSKKI